MSAETEEFLEHFGKKGMKWGVNRLDRRVNINAASRAGNDQVGENFRARYVKKNADGTKSVKKAKVAAGVVDTFALGFYTGTQITQAAGFTKGQAVAISMLGGGGFGSVMAANIKITRDATKFVDANMKAK